MNSLIKAVKKNKLYTRDELKTFSKKIDFDLAYLCDKKIITKKYHGIYSRSNAQISNEQLIDKIMDHSNSAHYLIIDPTNCSQLYQHELGLNENIYIILNNKRSDTISANDLTFKFQIPFNGFPKKLSEEFLLIYLMNTKSQNEMFSKFASNASMEFLKILLACAKKHGNKSTFKFLEFTIQRQIEINDISFELASMGAPLIISEELKDFKKSNRDVTEILAKACEIAINEPRIHNILPYTILKNLNKFDINKFAKLTKKNNAYRYAGMLLDLVTTISNKDGPTLKPPRYHRSPVFMFKDLYSPRAIRRIEKHHFDMAETKWGILIDTSLEREADKIRKWS